MIQRSSNKLGFRFDLSINLGQVISLISMIIGFSIWCATLDAAIKTNKAVQDVYNSGVNDKITSLRDDTAKGFDEVKASLLRIEDKMDRKK